MGTLSNGLLLGDHVGRAPTAAGAWPRRVSGDTAARPSRCDVTFLGVLSISDSRDLGLCCNIASLVHGRATASLHDAIIRSENAGRPIAREAVDWSWSWNARR
jgi:hypothetical protein